MNALTHALSAALIHMIWQGALIGWVLWIALILLRNSSAQARYAVNCAALSLLAITFVVTVAGVLYLHAMPAGLPGVSSAAPATASPRDLVGIPRAMLPIWIEPDAPHFRWLAWVQVWALPTWSAGVLVFSIRLALGCAQAFTLGHRGDPADDSVMAFVRAVAGRMGVTRPIRVLMSSIPDGPSVLGWLWPVILLPPAAMTGLTPEQLEAVIAHEIAHVTRHDYVVNVLQSLVETVLFYHPITWWISEQIRIERELCCDDLAVRTCGNKLGYAQALVKLAKMQIAAPKLAMASTGGPLLHRIQRLLSVPAQEYGPSRWSGLLALCMGLACVGLNLNWGRLFALEDADAPHFEVASVKVNQQNNGFVMVHTQGGRYTATGMSLRSLIQMAYKVQTDQIVGGPRWLDSERFDIIATEGPRPPEPTPAPNGRPTSEQLMIRSLLAERFQLTVHRETRDRPVYMLVLARRDGRLGPKLHKVDVDCAALEATARARSSSAPPPAARGPRGCSTYVLPGTILANGRTMAQLATAFSQLSNTGMSLDRPVVDGTGLAGRFDVTLHFTPERIPDVTPDGLPISAPPIDPNGPSIFTAVQEQLGLKLDPQRGSVDVLVIDRAEQPSEN